MTSAVSYRALGPLSLRFGVAMIVAISLSALTGCTHTSSPQNTPSTTRTASTAFSIRCSSLVTSAQMDAFNPAFSLDPDYTPAHNSLQSAIVAWHGTACGWTNQKNGEVLQIAVATPPASQRDTLKDAAISVAKPVPTYGTSPVEGYFRPGSQGQVQVFSGEYWIVAESSAFFEPGDAQTLMQNVLANLPTASDDGHL